MKNPQQIRATRIIAALAVIYPNEAKHPDHLLTHALSDLRHLADWHGLSFGEADSRAYRIYLEEKSQ